VSGDAARQACRDPGLDDYTPKLKEQGYDTMDAFDANDKAALGALLDDRRFARAQGHYKPGLVSPKLQARRREATVRSL